MTSPGRTECSAVREARPRRRLLLERARRAESRTNLPNLKGLGARLRAAAGVLKSLDPGLRPPDAYGKPGGLLRLPPDLPTLVIPDLHTRAGLIRRALKWKPPGGKRPLVDLLEEGRAILLFLGDIVHSEGPDAPGRWQDAYREYYGGFRLHAAMDEEMGRGFGALDVLARAILFSPGYVLCLKGNHDNSRNREGGGDHGFYKFAEEGAMCARWLKVFAGADFRDSLAAFEDALPLAALGRRFAASHAEPAFPMYGEDLIGGGPEVVEALTWTANGDALPGSVAETLRSLGREGGEDGPLPWLSGHRPVEGRYGMRQAGRLIQIHAPYRFQGAWVRPDRPFDPDTDIREL